MTYHISVGRSQKEFMHPGQAYEFYVRSVLDNSDREVVAEKLENGKAIRLSRLQLEQEVLRAAEPLDIIGQLSPDQLSRLISLTKSS